MTQPHHREKFSGRAVFIFAAMGSAIGLGNIWRFPYVAYEGGGGAFLIPYLVALFTAGIPLLFLDYAIGHRYQGAPPLAFRRFSKRMETVGWVQVLIALVIGVYYAAIIGWALCYTWFSFSRSWGDDAEGFFMTDYLHTAAPGSGFSLVAGVAWPIIAVWLITLGTIILGVQKGIGRTAQFFIPVLVILFGILVVRALTLEGAAKGLNAFFTPHWEALKDPGIWVSAYGQIFFSLSVGFGIMITYASYLKRRTNLTGSGLVVALSNSSFELLAGVGVFATLGFMAQSTGAEVADVATSGIGLAFIAFPSIISQMPGGAIFGILFFGCLALAGITSLISIIEVVIGAIRDKFSLGRPAAVALVGIPSAILSVVFIGTSTGLPVLSVLDHWANNIGVTSVAAIYMALITVGYRRLPEFAAHLNAHSSIKVGRLWYACIGVITPLALLYMIIQAVSKIVGEGYDGYPTWFISTWGWGQLAFYLVVAVILSTISWRTTQPLDGAPPSPYGTASDSEAATAAATAPTADPDFGVPATPPATT